MILQDKILEIAEKLDEAGITSSRFEAKFIIAEVLDISITEVVLERDRELDTETENEIDHIVDKRLHRKPLQLIFGEVEFMGLELDLKEGVFIPRPETEILVEKALSFITRRSKALILELGVGSGAISCAITYKADRARVIGTDINRNALDLCRHNVRKLGGDNWSSFVLCDKFSALYSGKLRGEVDLIISNPPYIARRDLESLPKEVSKFDPRVSLDGGKEGLNVIKYLLSSGEYFLKSNGRLMMEIGYHQAEDVKRLAEEQAYFTNFQVVEDLSGKDRVFVGER